MDTFNLIVYGIVAVVLVALIAALFGGLFVPKSIITDIKESLPIAQSPLYLGKTLPLATPDIERDTLLDKGIADSAKVSLAFECNNPNLCCIRTSEQDKNYVCTKPISWDYDVIEAHAKTTTKTSLRCIQQNGFPICRVFVGAYPAQAQVGEITITQNSGTVTATAQVTNSGETNLVAGTISLSLEKYTAGEWKVTEETYPPQTLDTPTETATLVPHAVHTFVFDFPVTTDGNYKALFTFSGQNAGYDTNELVFEVHTGTLCAPVLEGSYATLAQPDGTLKEFKNCTNCNYAYECASAWQNKYPQVNYEVYTKTSTYCIKQDVPEPCEERILPE